MLSAFTTTFPLAAAFVTPWFAWAGAGLASIPIIIHILNRRRFKVVRWAAMEYLLQAMRKNRRRIKFEQWLLLAVRCLLIFFMGLALARPLGCENSSIAALAGQRTALHVLVIDNSYSMAYEPGGRPDARTHLDQAKLLAKKIVDRLAAGNEAVMVISAASPVSHDRATDPHAVTPKPTYDLQAARSAIDRIEQTAAGTDLNGALQLAIRIAKEESKQPRKQIYIFTDATKSAVEMSDPATQLGEHAQSRSVEALKQTGPELIKHFERPHLFALGKPGQWNQAVLSVRPDSNLVTTLYSSVFTTDVKGFGTGPDPVLQWKLDDRPIGTSRAIKLDLETPPQSTNDAKTLEGGPHVVSASLAGSDHLKIDDARWRVIDVVSEMKVLIVEGERGVGALEGSGVFLELALSPPRDVDPAARSSGRKTDSYVAPEPPVGKLELLNKVLPNYRAVFLTDVSDINTTEADQFKKFVEQGGTLIIFAGPHVAADNYNQMLASRGLLPGRLIKTVSSNDKPFHFSFDYNGDPHPYLREFKFQKQAGLTTAQIWTYWQVELPANSTAERVLDYVGTKDPAITAHSLGKGRVVFFSTTANADWNGLPPKPAFVALMHEILAGSVGVADRWMNLTVGDTLEVPQSLGLTAAPQLFDSAKIPLAMESVTSQDGVTTYRSARPMARPGVYTLNTGNRSYPIAVNASAAEADVRVVGPEAVRKALGDIDLSFEDEAATIAAMKLDPGNDLSWTFMAIVLAFGAMECFLAMKFGHYKRARPGAPAPQTTPTAST
jgi:hypothetical protein